jgi:hypothetical protein
MDRFEELVARSCKMAVFGPGNFWRKMGNNPTVRELVGDAFPVIFVPLDKEPPQLVNGTRWQFKDEHFGVHAFLSYSAQGPAGTIRGVSAICMLDGASRAGAEWLLETTRDADGELGALQASFVVAMADVKEIGPGVKRIGTMVCSGIKTSTLEHMINAYQLWKITPAADREALKDRRCLLCRANGG